MFKVIFASCIKVNGIFFLLKATWCDVKGIQNRLPQTSCLTKQQPEELAKSSLFQLNKEPSRERKLVCPLPKGFHQYTHNRAHFHILDNIHNQMEKKSFASLSMK